MNLSDPFFLDWVDRFFVYNTLSGQYYGLYGGNYSNLSDLYQKWETGYVPPRPVISTDAETLSRWDTPFREFRKTMPAYKWWHRLAINEKYGAVNEWLKNRPQEYGGGMWTLDSITPYVAKIYDYATISKS